MPAHKLLTRVLWLRQTLTDRVKSVVAASAVEGWIDVELDLGLTAEFCQLLQIVHGPDL